MPRTEKSHDSTMKCKAVVFDLFGTLVEPISWEQEDALYAQIAEVLALPQEGFTRLWRETRSMRLASGLDTIRKNIAFVGKRLNKPLKSSQIEEAVAMRLAFTRSALTPREDAEKTLGDLVSQGCRMALLSNCSPEVPELWTETTFSMLIDTPIFSCVAGIEKPDLRIFQMASSKLMLSPEDCVYVADGENGEMAAAAKLGFQTVLIRSYDDAGQPVRKNPGAWKGPEIDILGELMHILRVEPDADFFDSVS